MLLITAHCYAELVLHRFWNVQPVYEPLLQLVNAVIRFFCRPMLCISAAYAVMRCLCVSVTFVDCVKTNKDIFEIFSPSGSHTILVFPLQTGWRYSDGNPLTGASNACGVNINRDSDPICLLLTLQQARCCQHGRQWHTATISQVMTLISLVLHCGYSTTKRHAR